MKPNPKPEGGITNRPTKGHEYLFLLSKRQIYFYDADAIREPITSTGGASFGKQRHSTEGTVATGCQDLARRVERQAADGADAVGQGTLSIRCSLADEHLERLKDHVFYAAARGRCSFQRGEGRRETRVGPIDVDVTEAR